MNLGRGLTTYVGSENVSIVVVMGRRFVVKRVRKKLSDGTVRTYYYVYEQGRVGDRVLTRYVAPLEKIVEYYIRHGEGGPGGIRTPDHRVMSPALYLAELRAPRPILS